MLNSCPKPHTIKNKAYEDFVRKEGEDFHHESSMPGSGGGTSKKCSSYYGVSLSHEDHMRRHSLGFVGFWSEYFGLNGYGLSDKELRLFCVDLLQRQIIKNQIAYIESKRRGK